MANYSELLFQRTRDLFFDSCVKSLLAVAKFL